VPRRAAADIVSVLAAGHVYLAGKFALPEIILARRSAARIGRITVSALHGTGLRDLRIVQHLHQLANLLGTHRHTDEDTNFEDGTAENRAKTTLERHRTSNGNAHSRLCTRGAAELTSYRTDWLGNAPPRAAGRVSAPSSARRPVVPWRGESG